MRFLDNLWPYDKPVPDQLTKNLSITIRNQVIYSISESRVLFTNPFSGRMDEIEMFEYEVRKQNGYGGLPYTDSLLHTEAICQYLAKCSVDEFLTAIHIYLLLKIENCGKNYQDFPVEKIARFVSDFNQIMVLNSCCYRIDGNRIILVDSELQNKEIIQPVLTLLSQPKFENANREFVKALEHQRKGEKEDAIREANNAFESTMKVITGKDNLTAEQLVTECKKSGALPQQYEKLGLYITKLFEVLPNIRHQQSNAHGKGSKEGEIPDRDVTLAINLSATFISYIARNLE